mgnify:CR=1 FL=1
MIADTAKTLRFNTQPPEGGWTFSATWIFAVVSFQHTAARRRLLKAVFVLRLSKVSTHSRPKAAAGGTDYRSPCRPVSTHSRPKAAVARELNNDLYSSVSTHSRPKAAAPITMSRNFPYCFNTQPPEGGCRRLKTKMSGNLVSTHSRPKAAVRATR